jgi:hypothetical protein
MACNLGNSLLRRMQYIVSHRTCQLFASYARKSGNPQQYEVRLLLYVGLVYLSVGVPHLPKEFA